MFHTLASTTSASSLSHGFNYSLKTQLNPQISIIKSPISLRISPKQNQTKLQEKEEEQEEEHRIINRRNALFILGLGRVLHSTATTLTSQLVPKPLIEFGSQPQILEKTIRALVPRPKVARTNSKKREVVEVLVVDGIEILHNGPVRFDVYVSKAHTDVEGPDLGEFVGSLVNMPFTRVGIKGVELQSKGSLELGISGLIKDIEAEECENLAVSLISRLDPVMIGGLSIHAL